MSPALDKRPDMRGESAALLRFSLNKRDYPVPTVRTIPPPATIWQGWRNGEPLLCTDGCTTRLSGERCEHGHPTYFLRYFLDLGR